MLTVFKDSTLQYPVTDAAPLTFPVETTGGVKETAVTLATGVYVGASILQIRVTGADLYRQPAPFSLSIRKSTQTAESVLPNNTLLLPLADSATQYLNLVARVVAAAGAIADWRNLSLELTVLQGNQTLDYLLVPLRVLQADFSLPLRVRVLSEDRKLRAEAPGFTWGAYRWRDQVATNAQVLVPTNWSVDLSRLPDNLWQAGMGYGADLALNRLYRQDHSIYPIVQNGEYFTGKQRYFSPSKDSEIEIFPLQGVRQYTLAAKPARQTPVFVGTFQADTTGYFDARVRYRYRGTGPWDAADPGPQFTLDRSRRTITINQEVMATDIFLGFAPPNTTTLQIQLPIYPVWQVNHIYLDTPEHACVLAAFDRKAGTIQVNLPDGVAGRRLYLSYLPALVAMYETEPVASDPTDPSAAQPGEQLVATDLNPAFAGISQGTLYLLHRTPRVTQLVLSVDKPRLTIPASKASILNLTAFGPISYENEFALLLVTALGANPKERIAGAKLRLVPGTDFAGQVNSVDPTRETVSVLTGGDGISTFVYRPPVSYGYYLDPTSVTSATLTLPIPVALRQLWNAQDGWLLTTYTVGNDAATLGKLGANTATGEIAWATNGIPGTTSYQTNGYRTVWKSAGKPVTPIQALDSSNTTAFLGDGTVNSAFDGNAVTLVYASPLPTTSRIGAYFLGFTGLCTLQVQEEDTGILSNTILLQLTPSQEVVDTAALQGYLYLSSGSAAKSGRLNANRLGGGPLPQVPFYTPLVS